LTLGLEHHRGQNIIQSLNMKDNNLRRLSLEKKYFLGQSEDLNFGGLQIAYCSLTNPVESGVNIFLNVWTVTNFLARAGAGERPFRIEFIFDIEDIENYTISQNIACTNRIEPCGEEKAIIRYKDELGINVNELGGIRGFTRQTRDYTTIISNEDGKYIVPPSKSLGIVMHDTDEGLSRVAFGWYEEEIENFS